jgi:hypothetical protein
VLHPLQARVAARDVPALRVTLDPGGPPPDLTPWAAGLTHLWIRAPDARAARGLPVTGAQEIWELAQTAGLDGGLGDHRVARLVVRRPGDMEVALGTGVAEVKLLLDRPGWAWVRMHLDKLPPGLVLGMAVPERLSEVLAAALDLTDPALRALAPRGVRLEDLPPCLGGALPEAGAPDFVDLEVLDDAGRLDPDRFVTRYIQDRYRAHSLRCDACMHRRRCPGLHVNLIRAHGFAVLQPVINPPNGSAPGSTGPAGRPGG